MNKNDPLVEKSRGICARASLNVECSRRRPLPQPIYIQGDPRGLTRFELPRVKMKLFFFFFYTRTRLRILTVFNFSIKYQRLSNKTNFCIILFHEKKNQSCSK